MEIYFQQAQTDLHLQQIITLQAENLRGLHSKEMEREEGFVTVHHSLQLLRTMNDKLPHIIAIHENKVVGYALAMPAGFREHIPELRSMFDVLDSLVWQGKSFSEYNYLVMGQVCIAKEWRGRGIFRQLYDYYFELYKSRFDWIITEVAQRNQRSLQAHLSIGFVPVYTYIEEGVEEWVVMVY